MLIGCSTFCVDSGIPLIEKLRIIKDAGFPFIGICAEDLPDVADISSVIKAVSEIKISISSCHCPTILDMKDDVGQTVDSLYNELATAVAIGCKFFVISFESGGAQEQSEYAHSILVKLLPIAHAHKVIIGIENTDFEHIQNIASVIANINSPFVRSVFNIGNCTNNGGNLNPECSAQAIDILGRSIIEIHVSDADKEQSHLIPGKGQTLWVKLGIAILRTKYRGYWMLEYKNKEPALTLSEGMDFIYKFTGRQRVVM
ncbi:hypothetical protein B9J78_02825 [bacterium Unc6]|nr:hypothetical protein [bacterium Unc6]